MPFGKDPDISLTATFPSAAEPSLYTDQDANNIMRLASENKTSLGNAQDIYDGENLDKRIKTASDNLQNTPAVAFQDKPYLDRIRIAHRYFGKEAAALTALEPVVAATQWVGDAIGRGTSRAIFLPEIVKAIGNQLDPERFKDMSADDILDSAYNYQPDIVGRMAAETIKVGLQFAMAQKIIPTAQDISLIQKLITCTKHGALVGAAEYGAGKAAGMDVSIWDVPKTAVWATVFGATGMAVPNRIVRTAITAPSTGLFTKLMGGTNTDALLSAAQVVGFEAAGAFTEHVAKGRNKQAIEMARKANPDLVKFTDKQIMDLAKEKPEVVSEKMEKISPKPPPEAAKPAPDASLAAKTPENAVVAPSPSAEQATQGTGKQAGEITRQDAQTNAMKEIRETQDAIRKKYDTQINAETDQVKKRKLVKKRDKELDKNITNIANKWESQITPAPAEGKPETIAQKAVDEPPAPAEAPAALTPEAKPAVTEPPAPAEPVIPPAPTGAEVKPKMPAKPPEVSLVKPETAIPKEVFSPEMRQRLKAALETAKKKIPIVTEEISKARGRIAGGIRPKIKSMQEKGLPAEEAIKRSIPSGELTQYTERFPSIREALPAEELDALFAAIPEQIPKGKEFQIRNTQESLTKLIDGSYLTLGEAGLLRKCFRDIAPEIAKAAEQRVSFGDRAWRTMQLIGNIPYTTLTSVFEMSGLGRQGRMLIQRYPSLAPEFAKKYLQAFASEEAAQKMVADIESNPNTPRMIRCGLDITETPEFYGDLARVEESKIAVPILERVPVLGKYIIRPTARSYVAALNWYRAAIVDRVITASERNGKPITDKELRKLCSDINDLSARSKLPGALVKIAPFINMFFAPRIAVSRVKIIGKSFYRPNVALASASLIGTNLLIMSLAKMLWPDDVEIEPDLRAADGGKIKTGMTRIDLWAGELPYFRTLMRLATGETKTASGKYIPIEYQKEIFNVLRSRESPLWSLVTDAVMGTSFIGEKFGAPPRGQWGEKLTGAGIPEWVQGVGKEVWNRLGPLTMQDTTDALIEEGIPMALLATTLSGTGTGVQTYTPTEHTVFTKTKDRIANEEYEKDWDNLTPRQQELLVRKYPEIKQAELAAKKSRAEEPSVYKESEEEYKTSVRIFKSLDEESQAILKELGIKDIGISRRIGANKFYLNDERYADYEEEVKRLLPAKIRAIKLSGLSVDEKIKRIQTITGNVKEYVRKRLLKRISVGQI